MVLIVAALLIEYIMLPEEAMMIFTVFPLLKTMAYLAFFIVCFKNGYSDQNKGYPAFRLRLGGFLALELLGLLTFAVATLAFAAMAMEEGYSFLIEALALTAAILLGTLYAAPRMNIALPPYTVVCSVMFTYTSLWVLASMPPAVLCVSNGIKFLAVIWMITADSLILWFDPPSKKAKRKSRFR